MAVNKIALAAMAFVVAACAGSSPSISPPSGSPSPLTPSATHTATPTPRPACPPAPTPRPIAANEQVIIDWWQVDAGKAGNEIWQQTADQYMAAHREVKIKITLVENTPADIDAVMARLFAANNAEELPDLLPSWGGGTMAAQADACFLRDITADVSSWKDQLNPSAVAMHSYQGKQFGIPWDTGIFGFWYNKALFAKAGIVGTPQTWTQFLADIDKLKAAKIVPYALAGKDQWPGLHLWTYLVLREGGSDVMTQMLSSRNWNTEACVAGGKRVAELVAKAPFQEGYMSASYARPETSEAASMGNGQAAMELMGQWAESIQKANSSDGKGIGRNLGWFPFPAVEGGKGAATDALGGSNGFAVGKDAPPEAVDFLHFIVGQDTASKIGASGAGLPVTIGTASSVTDPLLKQVVAARDRAGFVQNYVDQAYTADVAGAINAATAGLFDGTSTPEQVCRAITEAMARPG